MPVLPGGPKKLDEKGEAVLETLAHSEPPEGRKRWMLQLLADRIPDADRLRRETTAWETARNKQNATISWQFTTIDARDKLTRLYPLISKSS